MYTILRYIHIDVDKNVDILYTIFTRVYRPVKAAKAPLKRTSSRSDANQQERNVSYIRGIVIDTDVRVTARAQ